MFFKSVGFSDSQKEGQEAKAEAILDIYNQFNCDVLNVGSNDLANGLDYTIALSKKADFPFISANITNTKSGKLVFKPWEIIKIAGRKIGVIGVTVGNPRIKGLTYINQVKAINEYLPKLKNKTDMIIVLANVGESALKNITQQCEGIDLVIRSRSSRVLTTPQKTGKTRVVQMGYQGKYAGIIYVNMKDKGAYLRDLTPEHNQAIFMNERLKKLFNKVPDGQTAEEYYKESPTRLELIDTLTKNKEEKMQTIDKTGNYLWFSKVPLDKTIKDDKLIKEQLKPLEKKYGYK